MKTIFKILSFVMILSLSFSCDRPQEDEDYLVDRAPLVGFQGTPSVVFLNQGTDVDFEIIVAISSPIENSVGYQVSKDATSTVDEGVGYDLVSDFTIDAGDLGDALIVHLNYDALPLGSSSLLLNLEGDGDVQIGLINQYDLTIVKLPPPE